MGLTSDDRLAAWTEERGALFSPGIQALDGQSRPPATILRGRELGNGGCRGMNLNMFDAEEELPGNFLPGSPSDMSETLSWRDENRERSQNATNSARCCHVIDSRFRQQRLPAQGKASRRG